jgi:DNA repair and recombination protein RAD54B
MHHQGASAEGKSKSDSFTHKELRDLFTFDPNTVCGTHDLLQCPCETHKRRGFEADEGSGTTEETGEDVGPEAAQSENRRRFVDVDSSDSEPDMGFVSATQRRPDQYEKTVRPALSSSIPLINPPVMAST